MNENLLSPKQKEVMLKRKIIVSLRKEGYKHREIKDKLNAILRDEGYKEVSLSYVINSWNMFKHQA